MKISELEDKNKYLTKRYEKALDQSKIKCLCVNSITADVPTNSNRVYKKKILIHIMNLFKEKIETNPVYLYYEFRRPGCHEAQLNVATVKDCIFFENQLYIETYTIDEMLNKFLLKNYQITPCYYGSFDPINEKQNEISIVDEVNAFRIFFI